MTCCDRSVKYRDRETLWVRPAKPAGWRRRAAEPGRGRAWTSKDLGRCRPARPSRPWADVSSQPHTITPLHARRPAMIPSCGAPAVMGPAGPGGSRAARPRGPGSKTRPAAARQHRSGRARFPAAPWTGAPSRRTPYRSAFNLSAFNLSAFNRVYRQGGAHGPGPGRHWKGGFQARPGLRRILPWRCGLFGCSKACATPSSPTVPVMIGAAGITPSDNCCSVAAHSSGV